MSARSSTAAARPVCVLGVGRSGTSLLANVVEQLGVDFGAPSDMLPPNALNPRGFRELVDINVLNDEIRATWGGTPLRPPRVAPGWEHDRRMRPFLTRIEELVARHFEGGGRWGFKHSGTMLTLPLWHLALGELDHVICVHNPLEVRASGRAARRVIGRAPDGRPADWMLWAYCYGEALRSTAGRRRTFVFYEDWFVEPEATVTRLAEFIRTGPVDDADHLRLAALVEGGLHRHHASEQALATADHVPIEVRALYFLMRDLAAAERCGAARAEPLQAVAATMDHDWGAGQPAWGG